MTKDRPIGPSPPGYVIGIVTCGNPMRLHKHVSCKVCARHRSFVSASAFVSGAAPGVVGNANAAPVPSRRMPSATLTSSRAAFTTRRLSDGTSDAALTRSFTPGPVSGWFARYHSPISPHTSAPMSRRKHVRRTSRPLALSSTARSDGHIMSRCSPRLMRVMAPGNCSASAMHAVATPQEASTSQRSNASVTTRSDSGNAGSTFRLLPSRRTRPTLRNTAGSRANHPTVSMDGANGVTPEVETAPWVGRKP